MSLCAFPYFVQGCFFLWGPRILIHSDDSAAHEVDFATGPWQNFSDLLLLSFQKGELRNGTQKGCSEKLHLNK